MSVIFRVLFIAFFTLSFGASALADAVLLPGTDDYPYDYVPLKKVRVSVVIQDQVATTYVDQTFDNSDGVDSLAASYYYPVPPSASVINFGIWEADSIDYFELQPGEQQDPGGNAGGDTPLGEFLGENPLHVPLRALPDSLFTIRLEFIQLLDYSFGWYDYEYPLGMGSFYEGMIDTVDFRVNGSSNRGIVCCTVENFAPRDLHQMVDSLSIHYFDTDFVPQMNLRLGIQVDLDDTGMWVMHHREHPDSAGHFLAILEPGEVQPDEHFQRWFTFVLDNSGSMYGNRIANAKEAAQYCIENLQDTDYFNIVLFNSNASTFSNNPVPATREFKSRALEYIDRIVADGGTNLNAGMLAALNQEMEDSSANQVMLLSDGEPTVGETNLSNILENISEANTYDASIFTVALGDRNLDFLRMIAYENGGMSIEIDEDEEDVAGAISEFYEHFATPAMIDIQLAFGEIDTFDIYPPGPYSIFVGNQTIITGRNRTFGTTQIHVTGRMAGERVNLLYGPFEFAHVADDYSLVPRMWAIQYIDFWIAWMDVHGLDDEIIERIIELSLRYGILTRFTNYQDDETPVSEQSLCLQASIDEKGVTLRWNDGILPEGTEYRVYRRRADGSAFMTLTAEPITSTRFTDSAVIPGTAYVYRVIAVTPSEERYVDEIEVRTMESSPFSYLAIHPNPFNNEARLQFRLDRASRVRIELYNVLGRLVKDVWNGHAAPGKHTVRLDGTGLASGVYFVRMEQQPVGDARPITAMHKIFITR